MPTFITLTKEDVEDAVSKVLAQDDVDEQFVRNFITSTAIDQAVDLRPVDKLMLVYEKGSKKAKRIAVDEKLKFS